MATIAILIGGAIANAVAFVGGNALYDKFGRTDGSEERIRHDRAIEDLQRATSEWNQKRLETLDFINNKLREKSESRNTFDDVDRALDFYNETHPDANLHVAAQPTLTRSRRQTCIHVDVFRSSVPTDVYTRRCFSFICTDRRVYTSMLHGRL